MFGSKTILIADASTYAAIDLADTVEACQGRVAGPVDTLAEALAILDSDDVAGAIVDCELDDAAALVLRLAERGVPLVMLTSTPLPPALDALERRLPVLMRPVAVRTLVHRLSIEMDRSARASAEAPAPGPVLRLPD